MDLRRLEAFAAVISTGGVTAAARLLGRSQPAVSRSLQELEADLGCALFERIGPRLLPTGHGLALHEDVERALVGVRQLQQRAAHLATGGQNAPALRVSATSALSCGLVPRALAALDPALGAVGGFTLRTGSPDRVAHDVASGLADLGLVSLPLLHHGAVVQWALSAPCVLALPAAHALAAHKRVPLRALAGETLISMSSVFGLRQRVDQALQEHGVTPARRLETNASANALAMVRAGLGLAVLEPLSPAGLELHGVAVRPIDVPISFFFGAIGPKLRRTSDALLALSHAARDVARAMVAGCEDLHPDAIALQCTPHEEVSV